MGKEVLVLFKTHLDIGYTDYAERVVNEYIGKYIPNAIDLGYQLRDSDTPFIWTVGSWLIYEGLKHDADGKLERAIRDGVIAWHALPFTTHTELMDERLFEYGLSLSDALDQRFGKCTIGAKMTDVPGHTVAMVPHLRRHGIEFLHIGVNTATPLPPTPPLFRWRCEDDEITVMVGRGYGEPMDCGDFIVWFAHTMDNCGPQSAEQIQKTYRQIREKYPDSEICAATLNDVAERVRTLRNLPVIASEIGDSWIHGVGTDPKKVGMYRDALRALAADPKLQVDISDSLLLLPEHTWGLCLQRYYPNTADWLFDDFDKTINDPDRVAMERSWQEQRNYLKKAERLLDQAFDYDLEPPDLDGYVCESADSCPIDFEISWQLFDRGDYARYGEKYITFDGENRTWATWDYTKNGLPDYKGGLYIAQTEAVWRKDDCYCICLSVCHPLAVREGVPRFWVTVEGERVEVAWFGKRASRLPQAIWLKFRGMRECWQVRKLGRWIDPTRTIGSPLIMATDYGVSNGEITVESLDAVLVAPFGRRLLDYGEPSEEQDLYFNLYNNIWNTNFPMWYSDDTRFRFRLVR